MEEQVHGDYLQHVLQLLSSCPPDVLESVRQSIIQGGQSLKSLEPLVIKAVVESLVEKSVEVSCTLPGLFFKLVALFRSKGVCQNMRNFLEFYFFIFFYFPFVLLPFSFLFIHSLLLFKNNLGLETDEGDNSNLQDD